MGFLLESTSTAYPDQYAGETRSAKRNTHPDNPCGANWDTNAYSHTYDHSDSNAAGNRNAYAHRHGTS
jgi:hypothetical protein